MQEVLEKRVEEFMTTQNKMPVYAENHDKTTMRGRTAQFNRQ